MKKENNGYITQIFDGSADCPMSGLVVCPTKLSALFSYKKFLEKAKEDDSLKVIIPYSKLYYFGYVDEDYNLKVCDKTCVATPKTVDDEINGILSTLEEKGE